MLALAALAAPGLAAGPPPPGAAALARADALSTAWGRCPTARPAHLLLARAHHTRAPGPRARRARAALRAWIAVSRECARPVAQPTVTPPG